MHYDKKQVTDELMYIILIIKAIKAKNKILNLSFEGIFQSKM